MTKEEKDFHKSRRKEFSEMIGKDSIALIFGNTIHNQSFDSDYRFKQYKNFYYLTGFNEPNSALLLAPAGININPDGKGKILKEVLYVQKKDSLLETWSGKRLGYENVKTESGIESGKENSKLEHILNWKIFSKRKRLYMNFPR